MTWTVVVPVKDLDRAKTRLDLGALGAPPVARSDLALAFALDTIDAVLAARRVGALVVVTHEPRLLAELSAPRGRQGVRVVPDPGGGLDAALSAGVDAAGDGPVAVLLGDLPALRPADLDAALDLAGELALAVVPDAQGTGTTLLTARSAAMLVPRFGPGSAAAHEAAGHVRLESVAAGLRQDVDSSDDLVRAAALGVGAATARVLGARRSQTA